MWHLSKDGDTDVYEQLHFLCNRARLGRNWQPVCDCLSEIFTPICLLFVFVVMQKSI
jgi:hypothetical protein